MLSAWEVVLIGLEGLETAVAAGKDIIVQLKGECPDLEAYLVLAHRGQQCDLTTNPIHVLENADQMVADDIAKRDVLRLLVDMKRLESTGANKRDLPAVQKALLARGRDLRFLPEVQIEIRFHTLRYSLVWALQANPLVDRELTPQTQASIQIVLGNLAGLGRPGRRSETPAP